MNKNILNIREVYKQALDELKKPFPSIKLPEWKSFNEMFGGFRTREFSILCGSTGSGKTTLLANMSAQLLRQGEKHFVMSVETGHTDYMKRILSVFAKKDLNTGEIVETKELEKINSAYDKYLNSKNIEFSLYDNRVPVQQLVSDLKEMCAAGCKIAFIDNLNFFMEVTSAANALIEMDRVIHELIILCKQLDMHVVMVMHPKKTDGKDSDGRVLSEFDIKGSSTAVQEAHNVFLFNRPSSESIKNGVRDYTDRELILRKMRRRGKWVGRTILFKNQDTCYVENGSV